MVAALSGWHDHHDIAAAAVSAVSAIPSHAAIEAYSVLTRLPGGLAIPAEVAARVLDRRFPDRPLALSAVERRRILTRLSTAGVYGGASYDGVIALEAAAHDQALLTLDRRAQETYRRLGVAFEVIG